MEPKHFSHPHNLTIHQMPQGETIDCSGCNLVASGPVYACNQCKFFLHEQCFHATRSINLPSHPLHPLTLVPYPTYPSGSFTCDSCSELGTGFSYTCSACNFDLHVHCASISDKTSVDVVPYLESQMTGTTSTEPVTEPTAASTQIQHKSHAEHALNLLPKAPSADGIFICNGCGENGDASVYRCSTCDYDLHIKCAWSNKTVDRVDHEHPLTLYYSNPYKDKGVTFECDVCHYNVPENSWVYCCLDCDYGTHVKCVWAKECPKEDVEHENFLAAHQEPTSAHTQIHQSIDPTAQMTGSTSTEPVTESSAAHTQIQHKSHAEHALNLLPRAPSANGMFNCDGCGENGDDSVYRCSTCDYDLHVKCAFLNETANRVDHKHPLTLYCSNPYKDKGLTFECDVCHYDVPSNSWIYCCLDCDYGTHVNCVSGKERQKKDVELEKFLAAHQEPSGAHTQVHHKSHAKHALNLLSRHPGANGEYSCNGCSESGNGSVYHCSTCDYDLHVKCVGLNETVDRVDHEHPLTLLYSNPYKGKGVVFECDVCHYNILSDSWIYCCSECAYGTHVNCVWGKERPKAAVELEKLIVAQQELSRLQQQIQMNRLSAQIIASSINGFRL